MPGGPPPRLRDVEASANGQLAFGTYQLDREHGGFVVLALDVLTLRDDLIGDVTAFRSPRSSRASASRAGPGPQTLQ